MTQLVDIPAPTSSCTHLDGPRASAVGRSFGGIRPNAFLMAATILGSLMVGACGSDGDGAERVSCASSKPTPKSAGLNKDLKGQIVFASDRAGRNLELFVMAADGSGVRRLTTTRANEALPTWSPDGTEIAFVSFQDDLASLDADASRAQVKVMRADGSRVRALTAPEPQTGAVTWSPDGQRIAFAAKGNIDVIRADGSQRRVLADVEGDQDWPAWSPDGDRILVTASGSGPERLSTIPTDGSDSTRLSQLGSEGAWSPDGRRADDAASLANSDIR
jgi:dipeptidyl aminopeptidase/acylaminoacyl peptidase